MVANEAVRNSPEAKLSIGQKVLMLRGLNNPGTFKRLVRPMLYEKAHGDPEKVHEITLELIHTHRSAIQSVLKLARPRTDPKLKITVNGRMITPFGTSAGLDKNGEALLVFSRIFGFQTPGTVVLQLREGNGRPRMATEEENLNFYNAQGFPSKGLSHFLNNLIEYRQESLMEQVNEMNLHAPSPTINVGTTINPYTLTRIQNLKANTTPIYVSICGLPTSETNAVGKAMEEMETLLATLDDKVDGFEWNPASPNTAALKLLRNREVFFQTAKLMEQYASDKLKILKIWPYGNEEREETMELARAFIKGGGDGISATNTITVPKSEIPDANWQYPLGGKSGTALKTYRLRAVRDFRMEFPDAVIISTGGIFDGHDAYQTFAAGANMVSGITPYIYYGPGLIRDLKRGVSEQLELNHFMNLEELQASVRHRAKKGELQQLPD